jgi:hypothetical protein
MGGVNITASAFQAPVGGLKVAESVLPFCALGEASCVAGRLLPMGGRGQVGFCTFLGQAP